MEISSPKWLSELEMMDCAYQHEITNYPHDYTLDELNFPTNFPATEKLLTSVQLDSISSSQFISFGDSPEIEKLDCAMGKDERGKDLSFIIPQSLDVNQNRYAIGYEEGHDITKRATIGRTSGNGQQHVIAERRRREKLSQSFAALSALIPGLNKTDKASVLGGAIKYVKELQERVKWAEEEAGDEEGRVIKSVPKIETRVLERDVLVRIHCKKQKGCFSNILTQIQMLKLTIVNSSVLPFGHSRLDITIIAQMEVGFCMTATDLGNKLTQTLLEFI
ncbi:transcription factor bHLH25-like [Cucurbita moschata]|uniref:Transcription factor bHLH25-like n=1 Tax=Cucurbita moschata TaxID=3662 RepID=A0A6J1GFR7_CUCMO|nr:transcription factor bHLH25-like [Cucurbita moschata]